MSYSGIVHKVSLYEGNPARYVWQVGLDTIDLNAYIGKTLHIKYSGHIVCLACAAVTNKSYNQGFCYECFSKLARNDQCVMNPHLCHYHLGTCREPSWGLTHCMNKHLVYLAWTSNLKVGITKVINQPTRWLDQGAIAAVPVCYTQTRYHAGLVEEFLKAHYADRTNWRGMLKPQVIDVDRLATEQQMACNRIKEHSFSEEVVSGLSFLEVNVRRFDYPLPEFFPALKSINLDKTNAFSSKLLGMKGQYLYLEDGVFNVRRHTGYAVDLAFV